MPALDETIAFVFILIAIGYGAVAFGVLKPEIGDALSDFVFTLAVPFLLFRTMQAADFGDGLPWRLWITYFSSVGVTWVIAHLFIRKAARRDTRAGVVAGVTATYSNLVLLGMPLVSGVFGHDGLVMLSLIISIHLFIMLGLSMLLFEWALHRDGVVETRTGFAALARSFVGQLAVNPLVIGILAGLAARVSGLELPGLATRLVDSLAGIAGPLALIAMGMSLRRFGIKGHVAAASGLVVFKLMLMPAVALAIAWMLGLDGLAARVVVVAASLPAGVNAWLIAARFNTGQRLASTAMTLATAASVATTLLWVFIAGAVFP